MDKRTSGKWEQGIGVHSKEIAVRDANTTCLI